MEKWYRASNFGSSEIQPVTVEHSTDKMLFLTRSIRIAKTSEAYTHFPTLEEAVAFSWARIHADLAFAKRTVAARERDLRDLAEQHPAEYAKSDKKPATG